MTGMAAACRRWIATKLAAVSPLIAGYMTVLYRMYGVYNVLFGFMGSAIAVTAFRRGERWAWWTLPSATRSHCSPRSRTTSQFMHRAV
jgi:fatty acid desaturase